jgi:hypothetical protein
VRLREGYAGLGHGEGCFMRVCAMLVAAGGGEVAENAEMMCHEARRQLEIYFGGLADTAVEGELTTAVDRCRIK